MTLIVNITAIFTFIHIVGSIVNIIADKVFSKIWGFSINTLIISLVYLTFGMILRMTHADYAMSLYKVSAFVPMSFISSLSVLFYSCYICGIRFDFFYCFISFLSSIYLLCSARDVLFWICYGCRTHTHTLTQTLPRPLSKRGSRNETICPEAISVSRRLAEI